MTTEQGVEVRRLACEAWGRHGEGANMRLEDTKGSYAFVDDDCAVHCSFSERARLTEPSRTSLPLGPGAHHDRRAPPPPRGW